MKRVLSYTVLFIALSLIGHSYVVYRFYHDGILSTGPIDGMEQMVPINIFQAFKTNLRVQVFLLGFFMMFLGFCYCL